MDRGNRRVVITGLGTVNPIGLNVPQFWDNLIAGKSGARVAKNIDLSDYEVKIAAEVDLPDVSHLFKNKRLVKRIDRFAIFAHVAACEALENSGIEITEENCTRIGALIGTGDAGLSMQEEHIQRMLEKGMNRVSSYYVSSHIPNTAPALFAVERNLQGPNFSCNSACATSNHAIGTAGDLVRTGAADVMFAGGAEAVITRMSIAGFGNIGALSMRNDDPTTASRPFDKQRDGFVMGEGSGVVCLEELEHAKARGAKIYAELTGAGFTCDAFDLVAPHPDGIGARRAMEHAIRSAGLQPAQVGLVNAHGTSTRQGDLAENHAIHAVFGEHAKDLLVHSTKSMTGHLIGAAGGVEIIASILAFERNIVHATINQFERDEEITLNVVANEPVETRVDHILSNSFGFGGQNATVVISRFGG
ncbi:MAG: beta-ketoacyl-ACP synthase II [Planctomycetota bacterium]